jgi:hypothetical protein
MRHRTDIEQHDPLGDATHLHESTHRARSADRELLARHAARLILHGGPLSDDEFEEAFAPVWFAL